MNEKTIDGNKMAYQLIEKIKEDIIELRKNGKEPHLSIIFIGNNPSSETYVRMKEKIAADIGIKIDVHRKIICSEEDIIGLIEKLNNDDSVHGIMVQLPLPKNLNADKILETISPQKDVDGLTSRSLSGIFLGNERFAPATPKAIIYILENITSLEGKNVVIINHSNLIGKPLTMMLLNRNATVDVCHEKTDNLSEHTKKANILITATGVAGLIKNEMVKEGVIVIDVGAPKGDVDFDSVKEKASYITPVPGGVGPITIAMLIKNVIDVAKTRD